MRQLGILKTEREAQRFAAWLVTQRIDAHAEQEDGGWAVWVRDEDHLPKAREALGHFEAHPNDPKYQNAVRSAEALVREEEQKRRQAQGNVVEMRGRWKSPGGLRGASRRCPLVLALIGVSVLVAIATLSESGPTEVERLLLFVDPAAGIQGAHGFDYWASIKNGEVWRLITPIFLHGGMMHLAMNMLVLFSFGGQIEDRRGSRFLAVLVLILAIISNVAQAAEMDLRGNPVPFGGMSGVGYGLFGYLLVKVRFDNRHGFFLAPGTTFILLLWFFLCIGGEFPPLNTMLPESMTRIANSAHAAGFFVGMAIAYAPLVARKPA
jgi:GlpG protein